MAFIIGLLTSNGKSIILAIVDLLSKHAHFTALGPNFIAPQVVELLVREVFKLHDISMQIILDPNPVFASHFWKELSDSKGRYWRPAVRTIPKRTGKLKC